MVMVDDAEWQALKARVLYLEQELERVRRVYMSDLEVAEEAAYEKAYGAPDVHTHCPIENGGR